MNYIVIGIITIIILFIFKKNDRKTRINSKIPGPRRLPIFGNLLSMKDDIHLQFQKWYKEYGTVYRIKSGAHEVVVLTEYPTLRKAFIENSEIFSERYQIKSRHQLNGCQDIALANGEMHSILKKVILSEMTTLRIKRMEDHIIQETQKLIKLLDKKCTEEGGCFEINEFLSMFSLNIILRFLFGISYPYENIEEPQGIIKAVKEVFLVLGVPIPSDYIPFLSEPNPNVHPFFVKYKTVAEETEKLIKKYQEQEQTEEQQNSILSKLIKEYEKGTISYDSVRETAIDMVSAGTDTSANTMIYCLISLVNNPDIQTKVYNDISTSLRGDGNEVITHSKYRSSIPYLSMVIKETFRLYPIALIGIPHKTTEDVEIDGHVIAAGTQIFQNIWATHRSENSYNYPNEFIPERFNGSGNILSYGSSTGLVHFGIGVRDCIGKALAECEIFTLLATLLNRYEFINPDSNGTPLNDIGKFGLTYQPPSTKLIIKKRK